MNVFLRTDDTIDPIFDEDKVRNTGLSDNGEIRAGFSAEASLFGDDSGDELDAADDMDVFGIAKVTQAETTDNVPSEEPESVMSKAKERRAEQKPAAIEASPPAEPAEKPETESLSPEPSVTSREEGEAGEAVKEAPKPGRQSSGLVRERFLKRVEEFKAPLREEMVDIKQMRTLAQSGSEVQYLCVR